MTEVLASLRYGGRAAGRDAGRETAKVAANKLVRVNATAESGLLMFSLSAVDVDGGLVRRLNHPWLCQKVRSHSLARLARRSGR